MLNANEPFRSPSKRRQSCDEKNTLDYLHGYRTRDVSFQGRRRPINLFACPIKIDSQYWYIGNSYVEADVSYLFVRSNFDGPIKFKALVEPSPNLDRTSHNETYLEKIFIEIMNKTKPVSPEDDPLCSLNANQLFRLCSAVNDVAEIESAYFVNYAEHYTRNQFPTCLPRQRIALEHILTSPGKYGLMEIRVNLVSCSINTPTDFPSFYLTYNPREKNAVFFLQESAGDDSSTEGKVFKVKAHIRDVNVLKYVAEIF